MNQDFISKAKYELEEANIDDCFSQLDKFYEQISKKNSTFLLHDQLIKIKIRHKSLKSFLLGNLITYEKYVIHQNKIVDSLIHFFKNLYKKLKQFQNSTLQNTVAGILKIEMNINNITKEQAQDIIEKITIYSNIEHQNLKFTYLKEGSVIIGFEIIRDYTLIVKLKSLIRKGFIKDAVLLQIDDEVVDRFCEIMVDFEQDLSVDLPKTKLLETSTTVSPTKTNTNNYNAHRLAVKIEESVLGNGIWDKVTVRLPNSSYILNKVTYENNRLSILFEYSDSSSYQPLNFGFTLSSFGIIPTEINENDEFLVIGIEAGSDVNAERNPLRSFPSWYGGNGYQDDYVNAKLENKQNSTLGEICNLAASF